MDDVLKVIEFIEWYEMGDKKTEGIEGVRLSARVFAKLTQIP